MENQRNLDEALYIFSGSCPSGSRHREWPVRLKCIGTGKPPFQIQVRVDGYPYAAFILFDESRSYICIPSLYAGVGLDDLQDIPKNEAELRRAGLNGKLARSFARAIQVFWRALIGSRDVFAP